MVITIPSIRIGANSFVLEILQLLRGTVVLSSPLGVLSASTARDIPCGHKRQKPISTHSSAQKQVAMLPTNVSWPITPCSSIRFIDLKQISRGKVVTIWHPTSHTIRQSNTRLCQCTVKVPRVFVQTSTFLVLEADDSRPRIRSMVERIWVKQWSCKFDPDTSNFDFDGCSMEAYNWDEKTPHFTCIN